VIDHPEAHGIRSAAFLAVVMLIPTAGQAHARLPDTAPYSRTVEMAGKSTDFMHARYYSPNLGRFVSVDSVGGDVGNSQSWNRYAYARNNPLKRIDPDGNEDVIIFTTQGTPGGPSDPWGHVAQLSETHYKANLAGKYETLNIQRFDVSTVSEVNAALSGGKDIVGIDFIGHSSPELIAVGSGDLPDTNISMSGGSNDVSPYSLDWSNVKQGGEAQIRIIGCRAGQSDNPVTHAIAQSLANASGANVVAPTQRLNFTEAGSAFVKWWREATGGENEWIQFEPMTNTADD
jgi:RHS repeat-associated protein